MKSNLEKGGVGEKIAVEHLQSKGHTILHCNYRVAHKEVDIISLDRDVLVFTEVKTRSSFAFGYPETAVGIKKQQHLKNASELFMMEHPEYQQLRFDVVSILMNKATVKEILHIEDAFY